MITDVFCKIINKELATDVVMEEEDWIAIKDIHPAAPVHILIIPKKHIGDLSEIQESDAELVGKLIVAIKKVAEKLNLDEKGYRVILNKGEHAGQLVPHLHFHLLGGRRLGVKLLRDQE